jgi:hypothetical protein
VPLTTRRDELSALGVAEPTEVRLVDAATRAAIATGAGIRLVPPSADLADGVGALLRWSDSS